jgi:hypothetical protein
MSPSKPPLNVGSSKEMTFELRSEMAELSQAL